MSCLLQSCFHQSTNAAGKIVRKLTVFGDLWPVLNIIMVVVGLRKDVINQRLDVPLMEFIYLVFTRMPGETE